MWSSASLLFLAIASESSNLVTCFVPTHYPFSSVASQLTRGFPSASSGLDMYKDKKGVIFDIDGTLADSWELGFEATQVVLEKNGIGKITAEVYHDHTRYCTPDRLARHAGYMPGDEGYEEVGERLGKEFDDLYVGLVSMKTAPFYPGVQELITSVPSDVAIGALTNAAEKYAHAVLETNCPETQGDSDEKNGKIVIYKRFQSIRGADTVPKPKPHPDGLYQVCEEMGLKPEDCVYVGDSPSDGASAHAAGMPAIGVLWGSHKEEKLKEAPFSHICRTVEELQSLLPQ